VTKALEDVIDANMILSGVTGNTAGHEVRLAVAHCVHDGLITYDFEKSKQFLHGEKVAYGTLVQMVLCEHVNSDIFSRTLFFMKSIGLPVCMEDLGIEETDENIRRVAVETRRRDRLQEGPVATSLEDIMHGLKTVNFLASETIVPARP
jgi:glycerol dehydrogenase